MKNSTSLWAVLLGLVVIAFLVFWPLAVIWALETLFDLEIGYTWSTYGAMFIVMLTLGAPFSADTDSDN